MNRHRPYFGSVFERILAASPGFTLVELMIVLLMLGIVAATALPELGQSLAFNKISAGAGELISALKFARRTALSTGANIRVRIGTSTDTFVVEQFVPGVDLSTDLGSQVTETDVESGSFEAMDHPLKAGDPYSVNLAKRSWFGGVDITEVDFSGENVILFDDLGFPSSGGAVTLVYGSYEAKITIDSLSGDVEIEVTGGHKGPM